MVKERAGATPQNNVGAVVERVERWDHTAAMDPDEGGGEELGWQLDARIVPRQGEAGASKVFEKI
jgi:hypothetical protein